MAALQLLDTGAEVFVGSDDLAKAYKGA